MKITELITDKNEVEQWLQNNLVSRNNNNNNIIFKPSQIIFDVDSDGIVDVEGNVCLDDMELNLIPVKFSNITGSFSCSNNNLTTLEGLEKLESVGGSFICDFNNLTTLKGLERLKTIGGIFSCSNNKLTSLEGLEELESVGTSFNCSHNILVTLEGIEKLKSIKWGFFCSDNFLTINEKYDINVENPGYDIETLELIVDRLHEKVKDHPDRARIVSTLKERKPNVYKALNDKYGYDESWVTRNTKAKKHKDILDL